MRQLHYEWADERLEQDRRWRRFAGGGFASTLHVMLHHLARESGCEVKDLQLDHDPALVLRPQFRTRLGKVRYEPDANDPAYLFYRVKDSHKQKTHGLRRPDSPEFSDRVLAKRQRRRERPKRKKLWPSRPFPKRIKHVHE
jgi:hypothetical protein